MQSREANPSHCAFSSTSWSNISDTWERCKWNKDISKGNQNTIEKTSTVAPPQEIGQAEVFNREVKKILEKIVAQSRKDWSQKLDEALWAYRTTYKA